MSKCSQLSNTSPFASTETHLISGGLSVGAANTSTEIVAIAMAGAGQKSSYTLIKKVYRLEVILHP